MFWATPWPLRQPLLEGMVLWIAWSHGLKDQRLCLKELRLLRTYYLVLRHASFLDTIERE